VGVEAAGDREESRGSGESEVNDADIERLEGHLIGLGRRLAELEVRIADDDEDSRRSLSEAFREYNVLASIIAPDLATPDDLDTDDGDAAS
jgi:hypothetical protein